MHMCCAGSSVLYVYNDVCSGGVRKNVTGTGPEKKAQKQKQSTRQERHKRKYREQSEKSKQKKKGNIRKECPLHNRTAVRGAKSLT